MILDYLRVCFYGLFFLLIVKPFSCFFICFLSCGCFWTLYVKEPQNLRWVFLFSRETVTPFLRSPHLLKNQGSSGLDNGFRQLQFTSGCSVLRGDASELWTMRITNPFPCPEKLGGGRGIQPVLHSWRFHTTVSCPATFKLWQKS